MLSVADQSTCQLYPCRQQSVSQLREAPQATNGARRASAPINVTAGGQVYRLRNEESVGEMMVLCPLCWHQVGVPADGDAQETLEQHLTACADELSDFSGVW